MPTMQRLKNFFKTSNTLHVTGGTVNCPVRGTDVDVEVCFVCPSLDRFSVSDDGSESVIECDTASTGRMSPRAIW